MIFFVIAALLVVLDQATKFYIRATMAVGATKVLIPNWLGLNYVQNTGAAFSSFDQYTMILAIVSPSSDHTGAAGSVGSSSG